MKVLFVDSSVHGYQHLITGLRPDYQWHLIDAANDGVEQITHTLDQHYSADLIQAIHILTHGSPGCLYLGNTPLNLGNIKAYAESLKQWFSGPKTALSAPSPQLLLYGCNVAAGDAGAEFIEKLHLLTGAEIAASTTLVGHAALGGNWDLDYSTDRVAYGRPIRSAVLAAYAGVLISPPTITDAVTTNRATAEETTLTITGITIDDPETSEIQTVTLAVTQGTLKLASIANLTGLTGDETQAVSFSGTLADINAALDGMSYTPAADFSGDDSLSITVNDGDQTATSAIVLGVTPDNDTPTIAPMSLSVTEGDKGAFAVSNFGIVDVDNQDVQIIVKIASLTAKGTLKFQGNFLVPGSTFSYDQIDQLEYFHDGTQTTVTGGTEDSFTVTVDDGAGGTIAETTIPITIEPVNQLPTAIGDNTLLEGQTDYAVSIAITDPDQTAANYTIEISTLPNDGVLKLSGNAVTQGQTLSSADLANLTYSHDGNDQGFGNPPPDSFDIIVTDDGGGTGTPGSTATTVDLKIRPNNDDPTLVNNNGLSLNTADGLTKAITTADLSVFDPDSPTTQLVYTLTAAPDPTIGKLEVFDGNAWVGIGTGASFSQDDLKDDRVRYAFHKDSNGDESFTDSFSFQVRDGEIREYPSVRDGGIWKTDGSELETLTFNINIDVPINGSGGSGGTQNPDVTGNSLPVTDINVGIAGVNEGSVATITNVLLRSTDTDNLPSEIIYTITSLPTSGSVELNGLALDLFGSFTQDDIDNNRVTFNHAGDEDFIDNFRFTVSDGKNVTFEETFTIDITPVNDAPEIAATEDSPFLKEADILIIDETYITLNDVDGSGEKSGQGFATPNTLENLTFKVTTLPLNGTLQVDQSDGNGFVTVTTDTVITKGQLNGGKLRYVHGGDEQFVDSFVVQANDNTTAVNNLSGEATINLRIASLNDDPIADSNQSLTVAEAGTGTIKGENGKTDGDPHLFYTDPDNSIIQRQYRIADATDYGTLFLNGQALSVGSVFTQADLDSDRITYTHDGTENYTDGFTFTVSDGGGAAVPGSYVINIDPANDAPELKVPAAQVFDTDTPLTFNSGNNNRITVTDTDLDAITVGETDVLRVTVDLQASGTTYIDSTLTLGSTTDLTVTGNHGVQGGTVTFEGTKDAVQAALDGLQVQVPEDEDRKLVLVVTVDDLNNGGPDPDPAPAGYTTTLTKTIALFTSNDNDAPEVAAPTAVTVTEDIAFGFTAGNKIQITDVDAFNSTTNTVTLQVTQGTVTVGNPSLITGGANNSSTVTLTGSLEDINAAIAGLSYKGNENFNGSDTLTITANDQGNTGLNNGASDPQEVIKTVAITLDPVNDAPSLAAPSTPQTITEASPKVFSTANNNAITIDDIADAPPFGTDNFTVTLTATNAADNLAYGTLIATTGTGATITGQGTASLTLAGTKAEINAALNGLSYTPSDYNSEVTVNLAVEVDDEANGGPGALTATQDITIQTSSINNAPIVTNPTDVVATEDQPFSFTGANQLAIDDPDDFGNPLTVTLSVGKGDLTLGITDGLTFDTGSNGSGAMTITGTEADLNAALASLTYQGNLNVNGADALSFRVDDLGNTGTGPAGIVDTTINIAVNPVNDAPTRNGGRRVEFDTNEDDIPSGTSVEDLFLNKFLDTADDVVDGSSANDFAGIAIFRNDANITAQGQWQWSSDGNIWNNLTGVANSAALVLPPTAKLRFLPNADFNGQPGDLRLRLIDTSQGGVTAGDTVDINTSGGTTQYSNSDNDLRLRTNVIAINDAPIATGASTLAAVDEDTTNPAGETVTNLFTARFNDDTDEVPDGSSAHDLAGVAVVGNAATTEGTWQYFNGSAWQAVGNPSDTNALLVSATDQFRFVPSANYNGPVPALTVHLIDTSAGAVTTGNTVDLSGAGATGDTTAYSSATVPLTSQVNPVNDAPTLNTLGGTVDFVENGTAVVLDGDASVNDPELDAINNWAGATLTLERAGGANNEDVFGNSGTLGTLTEGSTVSVAGTAIATVTANDNGKLTLTFNNNATGTLVTSALQQITYSNTSEAPPTSVSIEYTLNDGNTGTQGSGGALTATGSVTVDIEAVNDAPVATNDGPVDVTEDTVATGSVITGLGDDTDVDGDTLTVQSATVDINGDGNQQSLTIGTATNLTAPNGDPIGTLQLNGDGTFTFTPAANYTGPIPSVTYTITDGELTDEAVLSFNNVSPVNDAPVATNDGPVDVTEDSETTGSVITGLGDDSDVDGDTLTVESATVDINGDGNQQPLTIGSATALTDNNGDPIGTLQLNDDGTFSFTPAANYTGPIPSVTYTITDGELTDEAVLSFSNVSPVNDAPVATNDGPVDVTEDTETIGSVITGLGDDTDVDGDTLTVESATVDINGDGSQQPLTIGTATNLTATNGDPIGTLTLNQDGTFTFDPADNYTGPIPSVTYTITDGELTDEAVLSFNNVTPVNDAPVATNDGPVTVTEDTAATGSVITGLGDDSDVDGDTLTVESATVDINGDGTQQSLTIGSATALTDNNGDPIGTLQLNGDGTFSFDPADNYVGPVPSVTYTITDGELTDEAVLSFKTVSPVNDAPVATNDGPVTVTEDTETTGSVITGLGDDTDVDGDTLTVESATVDINGDGNQQPLTIGTATNLTAPNGNPIGTLQLNGDGTFSFDPADHYVGPIPSVTYTITDGELTDEAVLSFKTVSPVNDAPMATNDGPVAVTEDTETTGSVITGLGDDSDVDGDTLTVESATVDINGDGSQQPLTIGTATNLTATNGDPIGTLTLNQDGTFTFNPADNYTGPIPSVTYTITDGELTDEAVLSFSNVSPVNDAPVATNDGPVAVTEDTVATGSVITGLGDDSDVDGDTLTVESATVDINGDGSQQPLTIGTATALQGPNGDPIGTLQLNGDGTFSFTPAANYTGSVPAVTYTVTDGELTDEAILTFDDVSSVDDAPIATDDGPVAVTEDTPVSGSVITGLGNDTDGDGDTLTVTTATVDINGNGTPQPLTIGTPTDLANNNGDPIGTLQLKGDGTFTFTPATGYIGPVPAVTYTVSDGTLTDTATLSFSDVKASVGQGSGGADTIIGSDGDDVINGLSDNDYLDGGAGNDVINGGSERDIVIGGSGDDALNGGSDDDDMTAGVGNDVANGGSGNDRITGDDGDDLLNGGSGNDTLDGGNGTDVLQGSSGNDRLLGGAGADFLDGGRDNDILAGGVGDDTLIGGQGDDIFRFSAVSEFGDTIVDFEIVSDRLQFTNIPGLSSNTVQFRQQGLDTVVEATVNGIVTPVAILEDVNAFSLGSEHLIFGDAIPAGSPADNSITVPTTGATAGPSRPRTLTLAQADDYLASNIDLLQAFGYNLAAAQSHYAQLGFQENRSIDTFDEDLYLATNGDLIIAFGYDLEAATQHYIQNGYAEGRSTQGFNTEQYLASRPDLQAAFGDDLTAVTRHYIENTYAENRDPLLGFDGGAYIASYADLANAFGYDPQQGLQHYMAYGYAEGRQVAFEADDYIASHGDLIQALGTNFDAGTEHYIRLGMSEGRAIDTFDEVAYLNKYTDLQAAFGNDLQAATQHYITSGFFEGRTV
ncbi:MAG: tandem-95 repeat protein [Leptolyngbya sp. SIOISBB]|nr:tandem-95 repeat protein [Leptolyngbya sp. SIOISBB]